LSSHFSIESGAHIVAMIGGEEEQAVLLASSAGYGFVSKIGDMVTKNKAGKALMSLANKAVPLDPVKVPKDDATIALFTAAGRVLLYSITEVPVLSKGKGNKLINIKKEEWQADNDRLAVMLVINGLQSLEIVSSKKTKRFSPQDLAAFFGERAKRGTTLPKDYVKFSKVNLIS